MESVVSVGKEVERSAAQPGDRLLQKVKLRERVVGPLQEQHRNGDSRKVLRPRHRWLASGVKWKGEKDQPPDLGKRVERLGLRGHPPPKRSATSEQRQAGLPARGGNGGPHGCMANGRAVR